MFVFDVSDTETGLNPKPLPPEVERPFEVRHGNVGGELEQTIENAKRDGVQILLQKEGSQSAGSIIRKENRSSPEPLFFQTGNDNRGNPVYITVPTRYILLVNENLSREARYVTIVHELAHLYCGHLGTPDSKWWPDRRGLPLDVREFEAESLAYLICTRLRIDNPSEEYLSNYVREKKKVPNISLECIMKAGGLIEDMGRRHLKPRKDEEG
ncbi:MAG: ImmA/IrrE family metallo-endopeptidase [Deltaproteobacteria bacterium]|nr:ImmA/IrrE family metallo-endopeptidase [Deltaproteobacteria bacterium]